MMLTPINTVSSALDFALSFLAAASDEQYESIPNDEIVLLARKGDNKKKNRFGDKKKKKKFQKIMSQVCAVLSDFYFSSDDSSSSEEDEKVKCKQGDFTGLYLMGKSTRNISNSNSDVSDDLSFESLSLRVVELENFVQPRQVALQGFL
jgi:hypothetical protein